MCGKCDKVVGAVACGSNGVGILLVLAAAACRLGHCSVMGITPKGLAIGAALMLLVSISVHLCKFVCLSGCKTEEPHTH
ncbi:MAG: hypothetical protein HY077_13980 [Elusimicrobia bacterium]|nr:hypothetical protein [Elusimicrobiota bacterium]